MARITPFHNPWMSLLLALAIAMPMTIRVHAEPPQASSQSLPTNWKNYEPDGNIGNPGRREGGGTRGPCIKASANDKLTALLPNNSFGVTTAEHPTFYVYLPTLLAEAKPDIEFVLKTAKNQEIYKTRFQVTNNPGILSFTLPGGENSPSLAVNQSYRWSVTLICNPDDPDDLSGNKFVEGVIRRVTPDASMQQQIKEAKSLRDRAIVYARSGIWYDALMTLAELRRQSPNDPIAVKDWEHLLKLVGMDSLAKEPLFQPVVGANQLNSSVSRDP